MRRARGGAARPPRPGEGRPSGKTTSDFPARMRPTSSRKSAVARGRARAPEGVRSLAARDRLPEKVRVLAAHDLPAARAASRHIRARRERASSRSGATSSSERIRARPRAAPPAAQCSRSRSDARPHTEGSGPRRPGRAAGASARRDLRREPGEEAAQEHVVARGEVHALAAVLPERGAEVELGRDDRHVGLLAVRRHDQRPRPEPERLRPEVAHAKGGAGVGPHAKADGVVERAHADSIALMARLALGDPAPGFDLPGVDGRLVLGGGLRRPAVGRRLLLRPLPVRRRLGGPDQRRRPRLRRAAPASSRSTRTRATSATPSTT